MFWGAASAPAEQAFRDEQKIGTLVEPYLAHNKANAVSVGVIWNGQTWKKHFGTLTGDPSVRPSDKTIYEIGSISKVFTSLLVADAIESGQLKMSDTTIMLTPEQQSRLAPPYNAALLPDKAWDFDALAEQIIQTVMGMNVQPRTFDSDFDVDLNVAQRLAARYQLAPGFVITVQVKGSRMMAQLTGQQFLALTPQSETEWKYDAVDATLKFELPASGNSTQVTLHQAGRVLPCARLPE